MTAINLWDYLTKLISTPVPDLKILRIDDPLAFDWQAHEDSTAHGMLVTRGVGDAWQVEALRVLKPGGHLLIASADDVDLTGSDCVCVAEDSGFEVRDAIFVATAESKFSYTAKPATSEREAGTHDLEERRWEEDRDPDAPGSNNPRNRSNSSRSNFHPCLHPEALVLTDKGYLPINQIVAGDRVYTADGSFNAVDCVSKHPYTSPDLFEIAVAGTNYTTLASDNHPFLVLRPTRTKGKVLVNGSMEWVEAKDLKKGDYTLTPILSEPKSSPELDRPDDFWFFCGFYAAEGVIHKASHGKEGGYPSFTVGERNKHLISRIKDYFEGRGASVSVYDKKNSRAWQVIAFDRDVGADFITLIGKGASTKFLHPMFWGLPLSNRKAFLEGYLAGDGGVVRSYIQAKTVSPDLASSIAYLAESVGYKANLFRFDAKAGSIGAREFKQTLPSYQIQLHSRNQDPSRVRKPSRPTFLEYEGVRYVLRYIQSVNTVPYVGDVWNLTVSGNPTFQTAVGMSHNTVKPVEIMEWCLNDLPEGAHVVDPFLGSGTTGIACLNAHMNFTGIEITPDYLPIADARVRHWNSERSILEGRAVITSDCDTTPKQRDVDFDDFFGLGE